MVGNDKAYILCTQAGGKPSRRAGERAGENNLAAASSRVLPPRARARLEAVLLEAECACDDDDQAEDDHDEEEDEELELVLLARERFRPACASAESEISAMSEQGTPTRTACDRRERQ